MKKIIFLSLIIIHASVLNAQSVLSPETLWGLGRLTEHAASADGSLVVYGVRTFDIPSNKGITDMYILNLNNSSTQKITSISGNKSNFKFRPDGKKIGFICDKTGSDQIFEMNLDGTNPLQVSNIEGGLANFNYAPNQTKIYFTHEVQIKKDLKAKYPDLPKANARLMDGLIYKHWNVWEDGAYSHVFFANYADGKITSTPVDIMPGVPFDSPLAPFGGEEQLNFSADGKLIAYTCKKLDGTAYALSTNSDIYIYNTEDGTTVNVSEGNMGYDTEPRFSPDGQYLCWLSMEKAGFEADKNRLILFDLKKKTKTDLSINIDQSAGSPTWTADSKFILFSSGIKATDQVCMIDITSQKYSQLTQGDFDYGSFCFAGKNKLIISRMDISHPSDLFSLDFATGGLKQITSINKEKLSNVSLGKVEKRMVKTTDGKDMLTWVIYPPNFDANKKYPTLLYCQGGPQSTVSQFWSYRWNFQMMAANGYIIVAPNRRGLPSFGQEWNDQISGDWGGQAMKDLLSAIDDVSKEKYVDTSRRGAVGASYGGYSVYWLAGNHNNRFKTFISHCGVFNLESMYGTTEETFFSNHDMGGPYWASPKPKSYDAFSPHKFVQNWNTPILVIHNERDFRVPLEQGMQAFTAAQILGLKSKFLYFEDEGHWVNKPQNGILWQREFASWLDETLKNRK